MAPKPQVFKTPDGKEFNNRAEWRDYMMLTFYSFKNKVDEPQPLMKMPDSIQGQMFDIADCKNSTLLVLDHTEQVQIDQVHNCRILIGACASSIFIRNCSNCVFYTCCRQLRLREVTNSTFYCYSMAEVHIEFSNELKFAPFNGGYPDHAKHLKAANLDISNNLWYDIYDHNDPAKSHVNWSLLDESQYEEPWYPLGNTAPPAVPRTRAGHAAQQERGGQDKNMQSFSLQQMMDDAQKLKITSSTTTATLAAPIPPSAAPIVTAAKVVAPTRGPESLPPAVPVAIDDSDNAVIARTLKAFIGLISGGSLKGIVSEAFTLILANGLVATKADLEVTAGGQTPREILLIEEVEYAAANKDMAYATFVAQEAEAEGAASSSLVSHYTAILVKQTAGSSQPWIIVHAQKSMAQPA